MKNLTNYQKNILNWLLIVVIVAALAFVGVKYPEPGDIPDFPPVEVQVTCPDEMLFPDVGPDEVVELGTTHFTNVEAEDVTATDDLTVGDDATITGDLAVSGTTTWGITSPTLSDNLTLTGTLTAEDGVITDTLDVNGDIDLDGDGFDVNITAGFSVDGDAASNINVAGAGIDLTLESEAGSVVIKGDEALATAITLDANDAAGAGVSVVVGASGGMSIEGGLTNVGGGTYGTADGDNDLGVAGDLEVVTILTAEDGVISDTLDINGDLDLDGDGFDVNITAGFSIDADAASNINVAGAGIDVTIEAEAGRVVLKGDEAAANGVYIDADDAAGTGATIAVGASGGLSIDGGLTDIGTGTYATADGDKDLGIAGDLEVEGVVQFGANSLYPVGFATSGQQAVYGTSLVTTTLVAPHGLTTVTFCLAMLGETPEASGADAAYAIGIVAANACTLSTFQDDFVTPSTEVDVIVHWLVIGAP